MVHLAPLTPAWPADLLGVALILIVKTRATVYNHVHTTSAQYIIMNGLFHLIGIHPPLRSDNYILRGLFFVSFLRVLLAI